MNLIGNCCISNYLLRFYGFGNTNPFTWVDLNFNSFFNLLTSFETINWDKIVISRRQHPYMKDKDIYYITVDDKVQIDYVHLLFDEKINKPLIQDHNVFYNKIWEYAVQKYNEHKDIMLKENKPPMFVLEWEHLDYDEAAFYKMLELELKYKVAVITYNTKFKDIKKDNLLVIYDPHGRGGGYAGAGNRFPYWYASTYNKLIKNFLDN